MSQLSGARIYNAIKGLFSSLDSTDDALLKKMLGVRFTKKLEMRDAGVLATPIQATKIYTNDTGQNLRVVSASLNAPVTVAPNANQYLTVTLAKVDSSGTASATVGSYVSDVAGGTATAYVDKALTLVGGTSTVSVLANGWTLLGSVAKASTGTAIGATSSPAILEVVLDFET